MWFLNNANALIGVLTTFFYVSDHNDVTSSCWWINIFLPFLSFIGPVDHTPSRTNETAQIMIVLCVIYFIE